MWFSTQGTLCRSSRTSIPSTGQCQGCSDSHTTQPEKHNQNSAHEFLDAVSTSSTHQFKACTHARAHTSNTYLDHEPCKSCGPGFSWANVRDAIAWSNNDGICPPALTNWQRHNSKEDDKKSEHRGHCGQFANDAHPFSSPKKEGVFVDDKKKKKPHTHKLTLTHSHTLSHTHALTHTHSHTLTHSNNGAELAVNHDCTERHAVSGRRQAARKECRLCIVCITGKHREYKHGPARRDKKVAEGAGCTQGERKAACWIKGHLDRG